MDDKQALFMELGHILHKRNMIATRRNNARFKISYYKNIKEIVDAHRDFHPELDRLINRIDYSKEARNLIHRHEQRIDRLKGLPCPKKWIDNISGLRKQILKYEAENLVAKYDAAKLTYATRKRVSQLTKLLEVRLNYQNGYVVGFYDKNGDRHVSSKSFPEMYREVEAAKAIERMLKNGNKKEKTSKKESSI
jgi:hypothetical protein